MKKFLCGLLTAAMLFTAAPVYSVNVFAANGTFAAYNAPELVNKGETATNYIYVQPMSAISVQDCLTSEASFDITLDGGTFYGDAPYYSGGWMSNYNNFCEELMMNYEPGNESRSIEYSYLRLGFRQTSFSELPYYAEKLSDTKMRIYLPAFPEEAAGTSGVITLGIPYFKIPVTAVVNGTKLTATTKSKYADYDGAQVTLAKTDSSIKTAVPKNAVWINKIADLSKGNEITDVNLVLRPRVEIACDAADIDDNAGKRSFVVTVKNGKFTSAPVYPPVNGTDYEKLINYVKDNMYDGMSDNDMKDALIYAYYSSGIMYSNSCYLPYKAELLNEKQIKVTLPPIPADAVGESGVITRDIPTFGIPFPVTADGDNDVSIDVDFTVNAFRGDFYSTKIGVTDASKPAVDSSILSVDKVAEIKANENYETSITVIPKNEVPMNTVLTLTAQSGKFDDDIASKAVSGVSMDYDELIKTLNEAMDSGEQLIYAYYNTPLLNSGRSDMPFKVEKVSDNQIKIYLAPIPYAAVRNAGVITRSSPYFKIPIMGTAANKDVKITVQSELTDFMHSGLTAAKVEGSQPEPEFVYGAAEGNDSITASDAASIMQKVVNPDYYQMPIESKTANFMKYVDVDKDGSLTATDASFVLQKVLDDKTVLPAEKQ